MNVKMNYTSVFQGKHSMLQYYTFIIYIVNTQHFEDKVFGYSAFWSMNTIALLLETPYGHSRNYHQTIHI